MCNKNRTEADKDLNETFHASGTEQILPASTVSCWSEYRFEQNLSAKLREIVFILQMIEFIFNFVHLDNMFIEKTKKFIRMKGKNFCSRRFPMPIWYFTKIYTYLLNYVWLLYFFWFVFSLFEFSIIQNKLLQISVQSLKQTYFDRPAPLRNGIQYEIEVKHTDTLKL